MSLNVLTSIFQPKLAPKDFECSRCGKVIKQGRVYVKTNWGRYCDSCADKVGEPQPLPA